MKRSIILLVLFCVAAFFSGCEKDEILSDEVGLFEKSAQKDVMIKRTFEGICTFVEFETVNTWYDEMDDWRVTGTSLWHQPDPAVFEGTGELFVSAKNPHDENRGKWETTWSGTLTPTADGLSIVAHVEGVGVEGKVKGLKAYWEYTMDVVGAPDPTNPTFFYSVTGNIEKPQGPIKK